MSRYEKDIENCARKVQWALSEVHDARVSVDFAGQSLELLAAAIAHPDTQPLATGGRVVDEIQLALKRAIALLQTSLNSVDSLKSSDMLHLHVMDKKELGFK